MSACVDCGDAAAVVLATTACVHEHITTDIPLCQSCLDAYLAIAPWCCMTCEWKLDEADQHCCPQTLTTVPIVTERAS